MRRKNLYAILLTTSFSILFFSCLKNPPGETEPACSIGHTNPSGPCYQFGRPSQGQWERERSWIYQVPAGS